MKARILLALWSLRSLSLSGFSFAQVCPYGAYPGRLDEPQICRRSVRRKLKSYGISLMYSKLTMAGIEIVLAFSLMGFSGTLLAQICPYGAYPGRLDEPQICRPPPDDTNHGVNESDAPQVRWEKTWGAIAMDVGANNGGIGTVVGKPSKRLAQKEAIEQCRAAGGGAGCKVILSYRNQCVALASGNTKVKAVSAPNIEEAKQFGIEECSAIDTDCKIYYSACSDPIRIQ